MSLFLLFFQSTVLSLGPLLRLVTVETKHKKHLVLMTKDPRVTMTIVPLSTTVVLKSRSFQARWDLPVNDAGLYLRPGNGLR